MDNIKTETQEREEKIKKIIKESERIKTKFKNPKILPNRA